MNHFPPKILETIAKEIGTPCYVYSKSLLEQNFQAFRSAFGSYPHQINFAVKANSNLAVLNILAKLGSGFDIVSAGELERVSKASGNLNKIIFSGVGKSKLELTQALSLNIGCINIESEAELYRLNEIALNLKKKAPIAIRINPDVDPKSHPYISTGLSENKFGIHSSNVVALCQSAHQLPGIELKGLAFHIGSQILTLDPISKALDKTIILIKELRKIGIPIFHLDVGGGLGVTYRDETPPTPQEYVSLLLSKIKNLDLTLHIEPGRAIAANAGVLLTRVEYIKQQSTEDKYFAIVDAAMNDLLRPALYQAWHNITALNELGNSNPKVSKDEAPAKLYDIVGPVCETSDFLGKERLLSIKAEDLLVIHTVGAYGFGLSSNYNSRPRAAEVIIDGNQYHVVRERENLSQLFQTERVLPLEN